METVHLSSCLLTPDSHHAVITIGGIPFDRMVHIGTLTSTFTPHVIRFSPFPFLSAQMSTQGLNVMTKEIDKPFTTPKGEAMVLCCLDRNIALT